MDRDLADGWRVGRYMVFRPIAAGGMATVHLGRLIGAGGFSRTVAIKRLFDAYANDPEFVSMLLDEARLVSAIRHPNVVPTLDVVAESSELLVVMEYVEGESVANLTRLARDAGERIPVELAASIVAQTLHGLHCAHEARDRNGAPLAIVHRDVSPQNVLVGIDGIARVLDFGIAKAASRSASTEGGQLKGKAAYMAPEHLRYGAVDRRTDVFSAAVVFWELLAGRRLFHAEGPAQTVDKILHEPIDSPQRYAPEVPTELALIVMRGLERDPAARFESAEEMALAIEDAIHLPRAREMSAWVARIAAPSIAARTALIRELERASNPEIDMSTTDPVLRAALEEAERRRQFSDLPTDVGRPVHSSGEVQAQWAMSGPASAPQFARASGDVPNDVPIPRSSANTTVRRPASRGSRASIAAAALGVLVLVAATAFVLVTRGRAAPELAGPPAPELPGSPVPPAATFAPYEVTSAIVAPNPSISAAPSVMVSAPPSATTKRHVRGGVAGKKPDCRVPYVVDSKGHKHVKAGCQ